MDKSSLVTVSAFAVAGPSTANVEVLPSDRLVAASYLPIIA
jgi:hypothetical protein